MVIFVMDFAACHFPLAFCFVNIASYVMTYLVVFKPLIDAMFGLNMTSLIVLIQRALYWNCTI
jgi:hypothetical protein